MLLFLVTIASFVGLEWYEICGFPLLFVVHDVKEPVCFPEVMLEMMLLRV